MPPAKAGGQRKKNPADFAGLKTNTTKRSVDEKAGATRRYFDTAFDRVSPNLALFNQDESGRALIIIN